MNRKYLCVCAAAIVAGTALFSCNGNNTSGKAENGVDSVEVTSVDSVAPDADNQLVVREFIEDMYNNHLYEEYDFLEKHCTEHLLKVLRDNYDYDGEGYATWNFRTCAQDSKSNSENSSKVISIEYLGEDWYAYEFYDGGWKGKNKIKASVVEGEVVMDAVESLYDECKESL